jgi:hypothetical protein
MTAENQDSSPRQAATELAQRMLDLHPVNLKGICLTCGQPDCSSRQAATLELRRFNRLPKRRPGSTRPDLLNLKRLVLEI